MFLLDRSSTAKAERGAIDAQLLRAETGLGANSAAEH